MSDTRKIWAVDITPPAQFGDMAAVFVKTDGGSETVKLFSYFHDEISFTPAELLGLTVEQAHELRHKKDVAYLQS
jgi:hypothetical protein